MDLSRPCSLQPIPKPVLSEIISNVLVVQAGQDWDGNNDTGPLDRPTKGAPCPMPSACKSN